MSTVRGLRPRETGHEMALGRSLRVFRNRAGREDPEIDEQAVDLTVRAVEGPEIEFAAYAEDCRIFGFFRHSAERLSDALNGATEYLLTDVLIVPLAGGPTSERKELAVLRHELLAVRAIGARGNGSRRLRTRAAPITVKMGPYTLHGYCHGPPGGDPIAAIRRRRPMVPLTDAWIEYLSAGVSHRARVGPLIFNRDAADWVALAKDEAVRMPDLPAESRMDPHAKDMTGYITTGPLSSW